MNDDGARPAATRNLRRMPVHFGSMPGPRQDADGRPHDWTGNPERIVYSVSFMTERASLRAILPDCFELDGEPVVTVEIQQLRNLAWLAGRGYDTLGVKFPARFEGNRDRARGSFLAVLWENLADPIISGREELGYNKLYCEIHPARRLVDRHLLSAGWLGHPFFEMEIGDLSEVTAATAPRPASDDATLAGTLHHKYIPATGDWSAADADYPVLTPPQSGVEGVEAWHGSGSVRFLPAGWSDLPTLHHIVNRLAVLPQIAPAGASIVRSIGGDDLIGQRRLR